MIIVLILIKHFVFPTFVADYKFDFNEENRKCIRKELDFTDTDMVIFVFWKFNRISEC